MKHPQGPGLFSPDRFDFVPKASSDLILAMKLGSQGSWTSTVHRGGNSGSVLSQDPKLLAATTASTLSELRLSRVVHRNPGWADRSIRGGCDHGQSSFCWRRCNLSRSSWFTYGGTCLFSCREHEGLPATLTQALRGQQAGDRQLQGLGPAMLGSQDDGKASDGPSWREKDEQLK